jgi:hypothetical protein
MEVVVQEAVADLAEAVVAVVQADKVEHLVQAAAMVVVVQAVVAAQVVQ